MKDQIAEIIGRAHYGLYDWERIKKGLYPGVSLEDAQWVFDTAEEIDKLLFPEGKKPPVLNDTDRAIKDLESHRLPSQFSYRQAYFVGAQAQRDDNWQRCQALNQQAKEGVAKQKLNEKWVSKVKIDYSHPAWSFKWGHGLFNSECSIYTKNRLLLFMLHLYLRLRGFKLIERGQNDKNGSRS